MHHICLMLRENTRRICRNISLPILGGSVFCKLLHMVFVCFVECPRKGSHVHPSVLVINEVDAGMETARAPAPAADGTGIT